MSALTNRYEDDDASHLPPGMKRVGYDADTQRYTFRQGDDLWLGEPGSFYGGPLKWAGKAPEAEAETEEDAADSSDINSTDESETKTTCSDESLREHARRAVSQTSDVSQQQIDDPWGVPVVSISATGALPPDGPDDDKNQQRSASKIKRAATLTANVLGIVNRRPRK